MRFEERLKMSLLLVLPLDDMAEIEMILLLLLNNTGYIAYHDVVVTLIDTIIQ